MEKQLTRNFKLSEFFVSSNHPELAKKAMENRPGYIDYRIFMLCHLLIQKIRNFIECAVIITSGYRDKALNDATPGSSSTSVHMEGMAADFTIKDKKLLFLIFDYVKQYLKGRFGEVILYVYEDGTPRNIHIALPIPGQAPLIMTKVVKQEDNNIT